MAKVQKYKKYIVIAGIILSILFGVFIFNKLSSKNLEFIIANANNLSYINYKIIIFHFLLLTVSLILSFIGMGIITLLIYLFFEGVIIGFMLSCFVSLYKISGFFYSLIYIMIYKGLLIFLIIILCIKYLKVFKSIIKYLKKEKVDITKTIINSLTIILTILMNDIILLLFGNKIFNFFSFIIN